MQKIKIKYFTDKIEPLDYIEGKSDWIDMRASEEVTLKEGEFALIPLGVAMELPKGYMTTLESIRSLIGSSVFFASTSARRDTTPISLRLSSVT